MDSLADNQGKHCCAVPAENSLRKGAAAGGVAKAEFVARSTVAAAEIAEVDQGTYAAAAAAAAAIVAVAGTAAVAAGSAAIAVVVGTGKAREQHPRELPEQALRSE
jgi:hypothetical protein